MLIHTGFMEHLSLAALPAALNAEGHDVDLSKVVYYLARETIVPGRDGKRVLPRWVEKVFAAMERNQAHLTDVLGLPSDRVVEIGRHIEL